MAGSYVAGIGDEVLFSLGVLLMLAIAWVVSWFFSEPEDENTDSPAPAIRSYNSDVCPICIGPHRLPVETNCGHRFCGQCIKAYVSNRGPQNNPFTSGYTCPLCRQTINLLLINFQRNSTEDESERREIESCVNEFNVCYGNGPRTLMAYIRDCPILIRHLLTNFLSYEGIVWFFRLRVCCCLAVAFMYLLIPLDIIPEAMFGFFGLLDDVFIAFLCAIYLSVIYRRFLLNRASEAE